MKKIVTGLTLMMSATLLSSCGGAGGALNAALQGNNDSQFFKQLALEDGSIATDASAAKKGFYMRKGSHIKKGAHGKTSTYGAGFLMGIELTDAQKAEIKTLMAEAKPDQEVRTERTERPDATALKAVKEKINQAFVSDSFDAAALTAELEALKPAKADSADKLAKQTARAEITLKVWNILTAEQQAMAKTKAADFSEKMASKTRSEGVSPVARLQTKLNLTEAQTTELETAFAASKSEKSQKDPAALVNLLSSSNATAADIVALQTPAKVESNDSLSMLSTLHGVLTAEQRQAFVEKGTHNKRSKGQAKSKNRSVSKGHSGQFKGMKSEMTDAVTAEATTL